MNDLQSLLQERELLENKIREARRQQISEAIATCRRLIAEHELTESDLFGGKGRRKKSTAVPCARYLESARWHVVAVALPIAPSV